MCSVIRTGVRKSAALTANIHLLECDDVQRLEAVLTLELRYYCLKLVAPLDIELCMCSVYQRA